MGRVTVSVCGCGVRKRARNGEGECCGAGRAHLRTGSSGCAVSGTRDGLLAGRNGSSEPANVDGGYAPIQSGECVGLLPPGAALDAQGQSG